MKTFTIKDFKKNYRYNFFDIWNIFKRKIFYSFCYLLNFYPSSAPFLSGDTFKSIATKVYTGDKLELSKPEIIFLKSNLLKSFEKNLKYINSKFILISHNSDFKIDKKYRKILNCPNLIKWYSSNCTIKHPKLRALPLGLHNKRYYSFGITKDFINLKKKKIKKIPKLLYSFYPETNDKIRKPVFNLLTKLKIADHFAGTPKKYREKVAQYMFNVSPSGRGIDTYRVWESIYLRTIPIVINKKFYNEFKNLPILILDDWKNLQSLKSSDLTQIYFKQIKKLKDCKYIWYDYWQKEINITFKKNL